MQQEPWGISDETDPWAFDWHSSGLRVTNRESDRQMKFKTDMKYYFSTCIYSINFAQHLRKEL